ncbi:MAG: DUF2225 domain-containing protein [Oscillospiraceae bacterium]|nr:DUF2225 domain-containing protein [Oscillospiraceae bacterium]
MIDVNVLLEQGPCKKFSAGDKIQCPGQENGQKCMYILLSGSIDILKKSAAGGLQKASSCVAGDVFGGRELFYGIDDFTYVVSSESVVFVLTQESFNDLSWSHPDLLFGILGNSYMPARKPAAVQAPAPKAEAAKPAAPAAAKPAAAAPAAEPVHAPTEKTQAQARVRAAAAAASGEAQTMSGGIYPPGHKFYSDVEFSINDKLIFPKEYSCPFCKKTFNDYRVFRSKLYESQPMRYDLRKYFTDFSTEWYDVLTCHSCLFSTFHTYFTEPKPIKKADIEAEMTAARAEVHMNFAAARDINYVFTSHYLALICSAGFPAMSRQISAKLWGNLSWLYEDVKDEEMEKYAATQAAEMYERVYTESRLTPVQEQITCLSIAGMQSRAGIDSNLKKFLFTAKTLKTGDRLYAKLAEDFMYELKLDEE